MPLVVMPSYRALPGTTFISKLQQPKPENGGFGRVHLVVNARRGHSNDARLSIGVVLGFFHLHADSADSVSFDWLFQCVWSRSLSPAP
jgi:hypothetical protein